jgi:hypothetical protein
LEQSKLAAPAGCHPAVINRATRPVRQREFLIIGSSSKT